MHVKYFPGLSVFVSGVDICGGGGSGMTHTTVEPCRGVYFNANTVEGRFPHDNPSEMLQKGIFGVVKNCKYQYNGCSAPCVVL